MRKLKRREFITLLGGATATWPLAAGAQQGGPMRRIGVLMSVAADGPEGQARLAAFLKGLQQWGWTEGRNADRHPLGGRRCRANAQKRRGAARAWPRRFPGQRRSS